jgi:hypothetical protein
MSTESETTPQGDQIEALRDALGGVGVDGEVVVVERNDNVDSNTNKVDVTAIATTGEVNTTEECSICFDPLASRTLLALPCGHVLHQDCASEWLSRHPFCPHCRMNVVSLRIDDDDDGGGGGGGQQARANDSLVVALEAGGGAAPPVVLRCRVCAQNIDAMDVHQIVLPVCRHTFHHECIGAVLMRTPQCPWCRARVDASIVRQINDRRRILQSDPIQDAARLQSNGVRLQAQQVRLQTARFERTRRRGCTVLAVLLIIAIVCVALYLTRQFGL